MFLRKVGPKIQFSFLKIVTDEESYDKEQDKLQHIYQSRLIPIDGDHPYRIYSLKHQLANEDLINYMGDSIRKFEIPDFPLKKDDIIVPHMISYTANLDYNLILKEKPEFNQNFYNIERAQMRFKIDSKASQLRIMAIALDLTDPNIREGITLEYGKCGIDSLKKMCDTIKSSQNCSDKSIEKICPLCIDKNISNFIVSNTESELFKKLESNGIKIDRIECLQ